VLTSLHNFTGPEVEQEDDITLVTIERTADDRPLADFTLPSKPGTERIAMERVIAAVEPLNLPPARLERLKTAVSEATMNAIEHGNKHDPSLPVTIRVLTTARGLEVRITDCGSGRGPEEPQTPDLEAKLAGLQTPRGWGLFLIDNMVDELHMTGDDTSHTLELVLHLDGSTDGVEDG